MRQAARNRLHEAEHLKTAKNFERQVGSCGGEILCYKSAFQESHVLSVLADLVLQRFVSSAHQIPFDDIPSYFTREKAKRGILQRLCLQSASFRKLNSPYRTNFGTASVCVTQVIIIGGIPDRSLLNSLNSNT